MNKQLLLKVVFVVCGYALLFSACTIRNKENQSEQGNSAQTVQQQEQEESSIIQKEETVQPTVMRALPTTEIQVRSQVFTVELAKSAQEHQQGLSGHVPLSDNEGMLFIFDTASMQTFWMKDMTFPIDILWIREGKIVGIEHDVPMPKSYDTDLTLPRYRSNEPADTVLEIRARKAEESGINVGDVIEFLQ